MGNNPISITTADVNGDLKPDLIDVDYGDSAMTVLTNNGNGGFTVSAILPTGSGPSFVAAADLNGDGKPDLACTSFSDNTLIIYTNDGSGIFVSNATVSAGIHPQCITAASLSGTGTNDLIVADFGANGTGNTLMILTNDGSGNFSFSTNLTVGTGPAQVIAADVNGDGSLDLISANVNDNSLTVLTNNGAGVFAFSATLNVGGYPQSVVAVDVNGDGLPDLVSANLAEDSLTIWTNSGAGAFVLSGTVFIDPGSGPGFVVASDVNGDKLPDLITANVNVTSLTVLTNDGAGGFAEMSSPEVGINPNALVAADFNGDGLTDLASANFSDVTVSVLINTPPLTIKAGPAGNEVVSWPSPPLNWALQFNPDITTTNWVNYTGPMGDDGTNRSVTAGAVTESLFFRLVHP